jgi:hypothetical protein
MGRAASKIVDVSIPTTRPFSPLFHVYGRIADRKVAAEYFDDGATYLGHARARGSRSRDSGAEDKPSDREHEAGVEVELDQHATDVDRPTWPLDAPRDRRYLRRRCCIPLARGMLKLCSSANQIAKASSSNATATRRLTGSSTASS